MLHPFLMPHDYLKIPTVLSFSAYTLPLRAYPLLGQVTLYLLLPRVTRGALSLAFADRSA